MKTIVYIREWNYLLTLAIEKMAKVTLKLYESVKKETVMVLDRPREEPTSYYVTVFQDQ